MRRNYSRDLEGVDVAVSGVPLDTAVTHRPGARMGPRGIRQATTGVAELKPYGWGGFDPFETMAVVDYGDCWLDPYNPTSIKQSIVEHARTILASKTRMLTLGGDHYITYPLLIAHAEVFGAPLSLIHFDAHCDTWPDDGPDQMNHGTMFFKAVNEGIVDPKKSVQIGIRTHNDDFMDFNIIDAPMVHNIGELEVVRRVKEIVGNNPAYLTFDIDCLDPAFAPGTGTPVSGGLTTAQVLKIIRNLSDIDIVGMDIVEVAPPYDHSEVTSLAAAHLSLDMLCLWAKHKEKHGGFHFNKK